MRRRGVAIAMVALATGCGGGERAPADAEPPRIDATPIDAMPDANPCAACLPQATCGAGGGCTCPAGYDGDGRVDGTGCADVDECTVAGICATSDCVNTVGGFGCEAILALHPLSSGCYRLGRQYQILALDTGQWPNTYFTSGPERPRGAVAWDIDPTTGRIWMVFNRFGQTDRWLAWIAPFDGVQRQYFNPIDIQIVGSLGAPFSSLAFLPDGSLYGLTGTGAEQMIAGATRMLFRIDPATATRTLVGALPGPAGMVMCYDPDDGHMYYWTKFAMRKFPLSTPPPAALTVTDVSTAYGEIYGCRYLGTRDIDGTPQQVFRLLTVNNTIAVTRDGVDVTAQVGPFQGHGRLIRFPLHVPHRLFVSSPDRGPVAGGTTVTLAGSRLEAATDVRFGGVPATIVDSTSCCGLVVTSPPGVAPGPVTITARLAAGVTVSWTDFAYAP